MRFTAARVAAKRQMTIATAIMLPSTAYDAATNATATHANTTTRIALRPLVCTRRATPSGLITTPRRPMSAETATSAGTATATTAIHGAPAHRSATYQRPPSIGMSATSGVTAIHASVPATAPAAAASVVSMRVRRMTWPGVAPMRRSVASRSSRRETVRRAAAAPKTAAGTAMRIAARTMRIM